MKLIGYSVYNQEGRALTFETEAGYKIEVTLGKDGKHNVECDSATFDEILEVREIIKSGKVIIEV